MMLVMDAARKQNIAGHNTYELPLLATGMGSFVCAGFMISTMFRSRGNFEAIK